MGKRGKKSLLRKTATGIAVALLVLLVLLAGFITYVFVVPAGQPPVVDDLSVLQAERVQQGDTLQIGNNWLRRSESGLWECYIEGDAFERGAVFGMLTRELLYYQESVFVDQIRELVPSEFYLKILKHFIAFFNRDLENAIPEEYRLEIYGTSFACDPSFEFIGSGYQRQLNYHAAHDIGHALNDFSLVGCTSFSVWASNSSDSSLITGRNFDFYMGEKFAENKIVCFVNPDQGWKFMMVTWADMIGVVSGMNEKGLTVTLNAAKSAIPTRSSTPVSLLAREILQYAGTIEEACNIAAKCDMFVSESIMVTSASDGMTVIIEKSPEKMDVVYPALDRIICTNHFQGDLFAEDPRNIENINGSDSYDRYKRVQELLDTSGPLDVKAAAGILRDRKGLQGKDIGMGNQLSINQLIAHHAVIFKADSLLAWVSASPWQLGEFVAYDLHRVFYELREDTGGNTEIGLENMETRKSNMEISLSDRTIPTDNFLHSTEYMNYLSYLEMSGQLADFRSRREMLPEGFADHFRQSNPEYYGTYLKLGDYHKKMKDFAQAATYYEMALGKVMSGKDEREEITALVEKMKKKSIAHEAHP